MKQNFGLYLHIPFCEKKCSYCDFYSIERIDQMELFVNSLIKEIELRGEQLSGTLPPATSVFMGGGTPSLLSPKQAELIINTLTKYFSLDSSVEFTMECNPGTITLDSLRSYLSNGVNRFSFGVQSFNQSELTFLERIHSPEEAVSAVEIARKAGCENINIDLMFALPNQTFESYSTSLNKAISLSTDHISAYSLIYEEGTPLYAQLLKKEVTPSSEELDVMLFEYTMQTLAENGFKQYEISNFAKPDKECRHNQTYWRSEEYLSFGPSAHGYIHQTRYWNYRNLTRYLNELATDKLPLANHELLSKTDQMFERAFLELRSEGIRLELFQQDFGINIIGVLGEEVGWWINEGYSINDGTRLYLTPKGYTLCDELSLRLISALEKSQKTTWTPKEYSEQEPSTPSIELPIIQ
jgi:oxygen-independent coproporphyrinogen III oxidase